jgi:hypothetical protein
VAFVLIAIIVIIVQRRRIRRRRVGRRAHGWLVVFAFVLVVGDGRLRITSGQMLVRSTVSQV